MEKQLPKGSLKTVVIRNIAEFTRKHLCRNLFFDKVKNSIDQQLRLALKTGLYPRYFLVNFSETCKDNFFAENHQTAAYDHSNISSSERRIGKRDCKL